MQKTFGGLQFYRGDKRLNMKQLVNAMKQNELACNEFK